MPIGLTFACKNCGSIAERTKRVSREYCGDACYAERKRMLRRACQDPVCEICGTEFKRTGNRQKYCAACKVVRARQYKRNYNALNDEHVTAQRREYMAKARARDPDKARNRDRDWLARHKDEVNAKRRSPERRAKAARRLRERSRRDPRLVVHNRMASAIYQAIRDGKAGRKWEAIVGYSLDDLCRHLERQFQPGMTWENMGRWHIDHIIPKALFEYRCAEDEGFRAAWALTNLRPLWASENQAKSARRTLLL